MALSQAGGLAHLHLDGEGAGAGEGLPRALAPAAFGHQDGEPVQPLLLVVQRPQEAHLPCKAGRTVARASACSPLPASTLHPSPPPRRYR